MRKTTIRLATLAALAVTTAGPLHAQELTGDESLACQAMLCLSVIRYFAGDRTQSRFATLFAPLLAAFGMGAILLLAIRNFDVLSGVNSPFVAALPWLHVMVFAIGMLLCMAARHVHPALYGRLTRLVADSRT